MASPAASGRSPSAMGSGGFRSSTSEAVQLVDESFPGRVQRGVEFQVGEDVAEGRQRLAPEAECSLDDILGRQDRGVQIGRALQVAFRLAGRDEARRSEGNLAELPLLYGFAEPGPDPC